MLIAGCACGGVKERGAFGFSNEKSLMYWPSTLSCAWPCGALALGAGPPLPPVVTIDSTLSLPTIAAVGGVANTGAPVGQGYHAPRLDLRRRLRPRSGIWCH